MTVQFACARRHVRTVNTFSTVQITVQYRCIFVLLQESLDCYLGGIRCIWIICLILLVSAFLNFMFDGLRN